MRRLLFVAAAIAALTAASVAVAHGIEGAKTAKSVTGTFSATQASVTTRTCTTSDGKSLSITLGKYTGVSSGDPDLADAEPLPQLGLRQAALLAQGAEMRFQLVRETDGIVHLDLPFERVGKYRSETILTIYRS